MTKINVSKLNSLTGHKDCIYVLEKGATSNIFFSSGGDGMVVQWDLTEPENGQMIVTVPSSVYALCYDESSDLLIVGQNFEGIHIIDMKSLKEVGSLKLTSSYIFDICINGDSIFVACGDGKIVMVSLSTLTIINTIIGSDKSARTLALNKSNNSLAVGFSDNFIRLYSLETFRLINEFEAHTNSVFSLCYSSDQKYLISASRDAHLKFWSVDNGFELDEKIVAHMYTINHIEFSPDNKYFVTCSMDKSIKVWDADKRRLLKVIDKSRHAGHGTSVNKLLWTNYKNQLVSCSDDRTISIWNLEL